MAEELRLFIALPLPPFVRRALESREASIRAAARAARLDIRWTPVEQRHLTLRFLGNIDRSRVVALSEIVGRLGSAFPAIETELTQIASFGKPRRARVLYLDVTSTDPLRRLSQTLDECLEGLGIAREGRPFRPHLTLGRFRTLGDAAPLTRGDLFTALPIRFEALCLYESKLGPSGAVHTEVTRTPFGRAP